MYSLFAPPNESRPLPGVSIRFTPMSGDMLQLQTDLNRASAGVLFESFPAQTGRRSLMKSLRDFWCALTHDQPTWPIRGEYHCKKCRTRFLVPWANSGQ